MTTEEKARAYEEAIERAGERYNEEYTSTLERSTLAYVFPELCESEDEKVRKVLVDYFKSYKEQGTCGAETFNGIPTDNILTWLEKQAEVESDEDDIEAEEKDIRKALNKIWDEKRGGQKQADNIEPKFKIGDLVVDDLGYILKIEGILNQFYILKDIAGGESRSTIEWANKTFHLWTIEDAKNGDILTGNQDNVILIFRGIGNKEWDDVIDYHCYYDGCRGDFIVQANIEYWGTILNNELKPATEEQRDFLFQKMKDAGYEWDTEQKKLKEIKIKQPAVWNGEDDYNSLLILSTISQDQDLSLETKNKLSSWFKSIKERYIWKPSEEQMNALSVAVKHGQTDDTDALKKLLEQLKKLMK